MGKAASTVGVSVTAKTIDFVRGMQAANKAMAGFAVNVRKVNARLAALGIAQDKVGKKVHRARSNLALMADRLKLIAGTAIAFGAVGVFAKVIVGAEKFSQAMQSSLAIMGDVSKAMRRDMVDAAIEVARTTKFSAAEVAEAYFFLASAGLNAKQSITALSAVAEFAQAGMFNLAEATSLLTDAQSALGMKSKDAAQNLANLTRVSDILVKANTLADASVRQFAISLSRKAAAKMKVLNIELEEGVAVLAAFAEQGIKAELGGRAFAIVMRDLTRAAITNAGAFDRAGIAVFDLKHNVRSIADIIADLERAFGRLTSRGQKRFTLDLGLPSKSSEFLEALIGSSEAIREFTAELKAAGKTAEDVAGKQLTPFQRMVAQIGATMQDSSSKTRSFIDYISDKVNIRFGGLIIDEKLFAPPARLKALHDTFLEMDKLQKEYNKLTAIRAKGGPGFGGAFIGISKKAQREYEKLRKLFGDEIAWGEVGGIGKPPEYLGTAEQLTREINGVWEALDKATNAHLAVNDALGEWGKMKRVPERFMKLTKAAAQEVRNLKDEIEGIEHSMKRVARAEVAYQFPELDSAARSRRARELLRGRHTGVDLLEEHRREQNIVKNKLRVAEEILGGFREHNRIFLSSPEEKIKAGIRLEDESRELKANIAEWEGLEKAAEGFFASTRNPFENALATLIQIKDLLGSDFFEELGGEDTARRAIKSVLDDFGKATKTDLPGRPDLGLTSLSTVGGAAGAMALSRAATVQDRELKELKEINRNLDAQNQLLQQANLGGMGP